MKNRICQSLLLAIFVSALGGAEQSAIISTPQKVSQTAAGNSFAPAFAANGSIIVFESTANNILQESENSLDLNIFRFDLKTSLIDRISEGPSNRAGNADSFSFSVSSNGDY